MRDATRPASGGLKLAGLIALVAALVIVAVGVFLHLRQGAELKQWTQDQSVPTVALAKMTGGGERKLVLPGEVQAMNSAQIHSRVSGYLKKWYVDIGAPVKAGTLLALIDSPEVDQQVNQARADLATTQSAQKLSEATSKRWADLYAQGAVSRQAAEEKSADLAARNSAVNSARANLDRLLATEGFKRITAPFAGVITARNAEIGALVNVGGDPALFTLSDQSRMRVSVRLPQAYSAQVHVGQTVSLTVPEYPGQTFSAQVTGDARAVDAESGAVLIELQLPNGDARLKAGEYAQVTFDLSSASGAQQLPGTAIFYGHDGPTVAVVGPDSRVHFRKVTLGRDLGTTVEVTAGLVGGERLVDNPPEFLSEGDAVQIKAAGKAKAPAKG
jgi:RND family efflux transporter MFP subunit